MARRGAAKGGGAGLAEPDIAARLGIEVRQMSAQSVILSRTVADRFGLNMTDLEVLDLIVLRGEASAGELAAATGLSSGSVTALIDRLVAAGYVERGTDATDRRKVLVRVRHKAVAPIAAVYADMQQRMFALWSGYPPEELALIADFVAKSTAVAVACAKDIAEGASARAALPAAGRSRKARAPRPARPRRGERAVRRALPGAED